MFSENVITFVRMSLFFKKKVLLIQEKPCFFRKRGCLCSSKKLVFYTNTRLSQDLLPDTELLKKYLLKIRYKNDNKVPKTFVQNNAKDRMTHSYISVKIKRDAVVQWLSLLHNLIQLSLNSGSAQIQTLLAACWRFEMVRIFDNGPGWK